MSNTLASSSLPNSSGIEESNKEKATLDNAYDVAHTEPFVEGGFHGYLSVFGACLSCFAIQGQVNAFGSYQLWYIEHQLASYSPSAVSWIGAMQYLLFNASVRSLVLSHLGSRVTTVI